MRHNRSSIPRCGGPHCIYAKSFGFIPRYATDTVNIVPRYEIDLIENGRRDRVKGDVLRGDLPALTVIEPQMHAHPQDDDDPDADMYRGQIFLKGVYDCSGPTQRCGNGRC